MFKTMIDTMSNDLDKFSNVVIKTLVDKSAIWDYLPVVNKPTGVSTTRQQNVLPNPKIRNYNSNYVGSPHAPINKSTVNLQAIGDTFKVDNLLKAYYEAENGQDYFSSEFPKYAQALALNMKRELINNASFSLNSWIASNSQNTTEQLVYAPAAPISISAIPVLDLVDLMNELCNSGDGTGNLVLITRQSVLNKFASKTLNSNNSVFAQYFQWGNVTDETGKTRRSSAMWNNIPMLALGRDSQRDFVIPNNLGVGNDETEIYAVNMGAEQFRFLQSSSPTVNLTEANGVVKDFTIDWGVAFESQGLEDVRKLENLIDA